MHNKNTKSIFIDCIDKVLKMNNISDELKNEVRIRGKEINFIKYPF